MSKLEGSAAVAHLLRRTCFGPTPAVWTTWKDRPYGEVADAVLEGMATPAPRATHDPYVPGAIQATWLERMLTGALPSAECLTLFWHDHFATSDAKVRDPGLLWTQYETLRSLGAGPFRTLLGAVSRDVAMIRWLDGNANRKGHPNENFARELQELFTLGIGRYDEQDVREVARAFTGWGSTGRAFAFKPEFHDDGEKTIHGRTGPFDGDDVLDLLCDLPACHAFLARALIRAFSHPDPDTDEVELIAAALRTSDGDIAHAMGTLLRAPFFLDSRHHRALVRAPVAYLVAALRAAGVSSLPDWASRVLDPMGQILFRPPSVKGWPEGSAWLSVTGVLARSQAAKSIAEALDEASLEALPETALGPDGPATARRLADGRSAREAAALLLASPVFQLA